MNTGQRFQSNLTSRLENKSANINLAMTTTPTMFNSGGSSSSSNSNQRVKQEEIIKLKKETRNLQPYYEVNRALSLTPYLTDLQNGGLQARRLFSKLASDLKLEAFQKHLGLERLKSCGCGKNPCSMLTPDDLQKLIERDCRSKDKDSIGECPSCGIELTMWEETKSSGRGRTNIVGQAISCWTIGTFTTGLCKTPLRIEDYRIICNGCNNLLELCYHDRTTFNRYRNHIFHNNDNHLDSHAIYFPKIEDVDEKGRFIKLKIAGIQKDKVTQWLKQEGFCCYRLPNNLAKEYQTDEGRRQFIKKYHRENLECLEGKHLPSNDPSIEEKKARRGKSTIVTASAAVIAARKRKLTATSKSKVQVLESDLYKNQGNYVIFKVPIDPRSRLSNHLSSLAVSRRLDEVNCEQDYLNGYSNKKKKSTVTTTSTSTSTSTLTSNVKNKRQKLTNDDDDGEIDDLTDDAKELLKDKESTTAADNKEVLYTNKVLNFLSRRFPYEEFLRWGLDRFRMVTPKFWNKPSSSDESNQINEDERKILSDIAQTAKKIMDNEVKIAELKLADSIDKKHKEELTSQLKSKLVNIFDSSDEADSKHLSKCGLVACMKEVKVNGGGTRMTKEAAVLRLPELLTRYGLANNVSIDELKKRSAAIVDQLYTTGPTIKEKKLCLEIIEEKKPEEKS